MSNVVQFPKKDQQEADERCFAALVNVAEYLAARAGGAADAEVETDDLRIEVKVWPK